MFSSDWQKLWVSPTTFTWWPMGGMERTSMESGTAWLERWESYTSLCLRYTAFAENILCDLLTFTKNDDLSGGLFRCNLVFILCSHWAKAGTLERSPGHHRKRQPHTFTFTLLGNSVSPISLTPKACRWTVGRSRSSRREPKQIRGAHAKSTKKGPWPGIKLRSFLLWRKARTLSRMTSAVTVKA